MALVIIILITSLCSDRYLINSQISIPLIISSICSYTSVHWGIKLLNNFKYKQIIREEGPKKHFEKSGTPTMGGWFVIPVSLIIGNLISVEGNSSEKIIAISFLTICFMIIGGIDDFKSLSNKTNAGLLPITKILLESVSGLTFLLLAYYKGWISSEINLTLGHSINLGGLIWILAIFVILAESNATNLTDGLDGLASGCSALIFTGLGVQLILRGNNGDPVLAAFCLVMAGGWLGFLMHNRNPAKIFMGDTGSLPMGASLSGVALLSDSLWPLLIMGGVFLIESLSVILQVGIFKITKSISGKGKRIFLMTPLHHHFELLKIKEEAIVVNFWLATMLCIIIGIILRPM